ncbi:hypothetical protein [Pseudomonas aeruginosa]|uniref:hypothetical protein n=1 Tax=Pseudomonas aeruginosa TaxID=287 RepID=UPI00209C32BE|nr:hypothetical protein [Pseudomonas aeruginosa]
MTPSKIQMDQIRSTSATDTGENIRAGSQKKSSLSPAEGLQGESPDATCTCPSGGGSLRHPCPAHPAVEQAGGDERDLQGAQGERDGWGPFPIVQVPWNVFDRAVMWVEDRRRYGDDGTIVDDWKALKTIQRAALAQPSPKCATCNGSGQVWISDEPQRHFEDCPDCAQPSLAPTEGFSHFPELLESVQQIDAMLKAEAERPIVSFEKYMQVMYDRDENAKRLDDAMARIAELEKQEPVATVAKVPGEDWNSLDFHRELQDMHPGTKLYAAPVAQVQPEETPGEILAAKLIETWVTKHGKPAPWSTAVEITAVATNMPNDERERLLALDDDVDAQAQHSVPEKVRTLLSRAQCEIEHLAECLENVCEDEEDFDVREDVADGRVVAADIAHMLAAAPGKEVPQAWLDVQAERSRQVEAEGWTPEHDDEHDSGELAAAGAAYALHAADHLNPYSQGDGGDEAPRCWPWYDGIAGRGEGPEKTEPAWWKPTTPRRDLVKACALALAEIERLDRAAERGKEGV